MLEPTFYPHGPPDVDLVETHISWVFLAGELAYKVRKPIVLPFLDYGSPDRRRQLSEEEVRLGRRLAPRTYLGVRGIRRLGNGFELTDADAANVFEYAVEMRRVDQSRTLATLLAAGTADVDDLQRVARRIAAFHLTAEHVEAPSPAADVAASIGENFSTLLTWSERFDGLLERSHRFAVAFLHAHRELFEQRCATGWVRDCHGDLRAQHVVVTDEIEAFDPVEFDPRLRQIDVAADLAFLVMDLWAADRPDLAGELATEYRRAGGDYGSEALLFFYAAYRAWVRAKVACVRAGELRPGTEHDLAFVEARRYAQIARQLEWRARCPLVVVVTGQAASGKSVLASKLAERSRLPVLSSDVVRKTMLGLSPTERAPDHAYAEERSLDVYRELGRRAAAECATGAIVDATFRRRSHRDAFRAAYGGSHPAPLFVECVAPAVVLAERARRRERNARISDADVAVVNRQAAEMEPLDEVPAEAVLVLRTDRPSDGLVDSVETWLDERRAASSAS